jgi:limonene-1,2-epoxide hydrolase
MKITCKQDCGNAPLKELLKAFTIAFGKGDVESITNKLTQDIRWEMVGDKTIEGITEVTKVLESMKASTASELTIDHIITHGRTAACNGHMVMKEAGNTYAFCDVYEFNKNGPTAKIKRMTSYGVKIN